MTKLLRHCPQNNGVSSENQKNHTPLPPLSIQSNIIRLTAKTYFRLLTKQVSNFERVLRGELKCEKKFENLIILVAKK